MLLYPAIDELKTKVDSKYTLVMLTAKRARDIIDGKPMLALNDTNKPLSVAATEVSENLISYKRAEDVQKAEGAVAEPEAETEAKEEE